MEKDRLAVPFSLISLFELNLMSKQTPMPALHCAKEKGEVRIRRPHIRSVCVHLHIIPSIVTDRKLHNQPQTNAFCPATFVLFLASDMNPTTRELDNGIALPTRLRAASEAPLGRNTLGSKSGRGPNTDSRSSF